MLNHHRIKVYWFLSHLIMLEQTNTSKNGQNLCKYSRKHGHFCFKWMLTVEKKIRYVSLYLIFAFRFKMTAAYKYLQSVFLMLNQTTTHNFNQDQAIQYTLPLGRVTSSQRGLSDITHVKKPHRAPLHMEVSEMAQAASLQTIEHGLPGETRL